ncbi:MAG: glycosyltransferase family 4 protein [Planctomycetaceae bacterium]|nr:glycosyltransferase family 4 protein [Planctomycetaceae bacterium]
MRLLYVTMSMPFGPGEAFFIPEVNELRRQGHELLIVPRSPRGTRVVNGDAKGLPALTLRRPVIALDIAGGAIAELCTHPFASLRVFGVLFKSRNPLTFAKNLIVFPKGLWLGRLANRWKADHIHVQWGLTTATMGLVASRVSGVPWSCTVHRGDIIANNLLTVKAREAQFFRVISEDGVALAAETCGRSLEGNVIVLHLGVDCPNHEPPLRSLHEPPVLMCPAHLIERKGQQYLLEALDILRRRGRRVRLLLAGEGDMRSFLESLTARYGLNDAVQFMGQVGHSDLLRLYQGGEVDMVVLPTLHEGIPVCLMEAMAHGVPVVSTRTGGIPELLRDGAGILTPMRDPPALADAIEGLLGDSEKRARLVQVGWRRVADEFSVEAVTNALVKHIPNGN